MLQKHELNPMTRFYQGVSTDDLIALLDEAKEQSEFCPNSSEKDLWRLRLHGIEDELLRRQEFEDQIEN